jgi:hypothetical protein
MQASIFEGLEAYVSKAILTLKSDSLERSKQVSLEYLKPLKPLKHLKSDSLERSKQVTLRPLNPLKPLKTDSLKNP